MLLADGVDDIRSARRGRLCLDRPAVAEKTPYRDGTTHIVLEPMDLMARLAALVPPPRMHLTRYHGVFAPYSRLRAAGLTIRPVRRSGLACGEGLKFLSADIRRGNVAKT